MFLSPHNSSGFGSLLEGRTISLVDDNTQYGLPPPVTRRNEWRFRPGAYTPREFVREIAVLLESLIVQLGPDEPGEADSRAIFMDGLRSSLSHEGREATLLLADWNSEEPSDLTKHILRIGKTLFQYASEFNHVVPGDASMTVYSPCEGHKWVPPAGRLLRSPRSSPILMMLYNEWLHQITCLRDNLIAFENFEDVVLELENTSRQGTRPMEDIRGALLSQVIRGQVSRETLVETAKALTAPCLPVGGYGFQYKKGVVLPATLFSESRSKLLRYNSAQLVEPGQRPVLFESAQHALLASEKIEVGTLETPVPSETSWQASFTSESARTGDGEESQYVKLTAKSDSQSAFSVDLGRIIGGLDAATDVSPAEEAEILTESHRIYEAYEILLAGPDVVANSSPGPAIIRATSSVSLLLLLGKLDPQGVRLAGRWRRDSGRPLGTNESSLPRFLIVDEQTI